MARGNIVLLFLAVLAVSQVTGLSLKGAKKQKLCAKERSYHQKLAALAFSKGHHKGDDDEEDEGPGLLDAVGDTDADTADSEATAEKLQKVLDRKAQKFEFETFPARGSACSACQKFRNAHSEATYVTDNKGICVKCFSVESSCNEGDFQWNCYDQNSHFKDLQKQGATDSAKRLGPVNSGDPAEIEGYETESGEPIFDDKAPEECEEE